nr:hypothetical protein [Alcaligenes sp. HPC1271]
MLNKGRSGTTQACRELGIKEIGNVIDWVAREPDVFVGSAWADVGIGVFEACKDLSENKFESGKIFKVGLQQPDAVRLIMPRTHRMPCASVLQRCSRIFWLARLRLRPNSTGLSSRLKIRAEIKNPGLAWVFL